ncbi:TetR/AcrR family transcriptional regulator [Pseudonocardia acaciae]|uniref:TetR/AcrR family transcriptional regulator n=1 Tax=Pseudonocardia acaciae TaxID=551276 RepID=UPI000688F7E1|nr:TetR/AcrR family transcriptional regulator [Pseudonocardia acaciae]
MARPPDPARRARTLARATDYVLEHGLAGLSLRPLAAALDTSTRMLLYDFGSKERLVAEILAEVRRRESALLTEHLATSGGSPSELLTDLWDWLAADERAPYLRLFFEVYVDAIHRPEAYENGGTDMVTDWLDGLAVALRRPDEDRLDPATTTLLIAAARGLLLDRLLTADAERTDGAMAVFAEWLGRR